jgi:hypothetical protein
MWARESKSALMLAMVTTTNRIVMATTRTVLPIIGGVLYPSQLDRYATMGGPQCRLTKRGLSPMPARLMFSCSENLRYDHRRDTCGMLFRLLRARRGEGVKDDAQHNTQAKRVVSFIFSLRHRSIVHTPRRSR